MHSRDNLYFYWWVHSILDNYTDCTAFARLISTFTKYNYFQPILFNVTSSDSTSQSLSWRVQYNAQRHIWLMQTSSTTHVPVKVCCRQAALWVWVWWCAVWSRSSHLHLVQRNCAGWCNSQASANDTLSIV